jgi:hypothetical protein
MTLARGSQCDKSYRYPVRFAPKLLTDRAPATIRDLPAVSTKNSGSALLVSAARLPATIAVMTTPDDQDWLRLAEEAFNDLPEDAPQQDGEQPPWRYRAPAI